MWIPSALVWRPGIMSIWSLHLASRLLDPHLRWWSMKQAAAIWQHENHWPVQRLQVGAIVDSVRSHSVNCQRQGLYRVVVENDEVDSPVCVKYDILNLEARISGNQIWPNCGTNLKLVPTCESVQFVWVVFVFHMTFLYLGSVRSNVAHGDNTGISNNFATVLVKVGTWPPISHIS